MAEPDSSRDAALPDVLQFMQLLWAVVHGVEKVSKQMSRHIGITGPQRLVLRVIGLRPGISAGDLAATLRLHPSTVTVILQRLVAQGRIARVNDPADRRRAVIHLTANGRRTNATRARTVERAVSQALELARRDDVRATKNVLAALAGHLDALDARRRLPAPATTRGRARSRG